MTIVSLHRDLSRQSDDGWRDLARRIEMVRNMERALQFLREHKEVALATCEGNLPKLRVFQIMKQEGNVFYFSTHPIKAVWKELMGHPNVEILAFTDNVSVRCFGMVNTNVEDDVKRWIYDNNPVLSRLYASYEELVYFCLPIAKMDYYDLSPTPPVNLHFDLMVGEVCNGYSSKNEPLGIAVSWETLQ